MFSRKVVNHLTCGSTGLLGYLFYQVAGCRINHAMKSDAANPRAGRRSACLVWTLTTPLFFIGHSICA
jgi:hypothetical protein